MMAPPGGGGLWDVSTHCQASATDHDYAESLSFAVHLGRQFVLSFLSNFVVADGRRRCNRSDEGADWWMTAP